MRTIWSSFLSVFQEKLQKTQHKLRQSNKNNTRQNPTLRRCQQDYDHRKVKVQLQQSVKLPINKTLGLGLQNQKNIAKLA